MGGKDILNLDYYYGSESEQYSFFRIPRLLIKDSRFRRLSNEAKLLYGLMLDRMSLSRRNGWLDEQNRAYIRYSISDVCEDLGCSKNTATKLMMELDTQHGIGLIERIRVGLGASNIIYVKNFASAGEDPEEPAKQPDITDSQNLGNRNPKTWESAIPENGKQESHDVGISNPKTCESEISECGNPDSQRLGANYNYMNKTEQSQADRSYKNGNNPIYRSDPDPAGQSYGRNAGETTGRMDRMDERSNETAVISATFEKASPYRTLQECKNAVGEQIGLDDLYLVYPDSRHHRELVEEIFRLLVELYYNPRENLRIGSQEYRWDFIIDRLKELQEDHIRYVIECFTRTSTQIHDIRSYLFRSLINAPATIDHYYQADANYDGGLTE